ncbi:MAG: hypothetical protein NVS4B9_42590 [Ktedonobacteraceae bacterium]
MAMPDPHRIVRFDWFIQWGDVKHFYFTANPVRAYPASYDVYDCYSMNVNDTEPQVRIFTKAE